MTNTNLETIRIGIDLGDDASSVCVLDTATGDLREFTVSMTPATFERHLARLPRGRVVIECGTHALWVGHLLRKMGFETIVADPRSLALIAKGHMKTDRMDARMLADLAASSPRLLRPVRLRSFETQRKLAMLRVRESLVSTRTGHINRLRMLLKPFGLRLRRGTSDRFVAETRSELPAEYLEVIEPLLDLVSHLNRQVRELDRKVTKLAELDAQAMRLMTIDGVGPITALQTVLEIEDPSRFRRSRTVGAYAGLTPGKFESGQIRKELSITKQGSREWRRLLVQCAHYIVSSRGKDCDLRRIGLEIAARGGRSARHRAMIAVARRLVVVMHRMMAEESEYEPLRFADRRTDFAA